MVNRKRDKKRKERQEMQKKWAVNGWGSPFDNTFLFGAGCKSHKNAKNKHQKKKD